MSLISYNSVSEMCAGVSGSRAKTAVDGSPIVLTADSTLMARYDLLFDGMLASSQTTSIPPCLLSPILIPKAPSINNNCTVAPLGLRRVEAALLRSGMPRESITVADINHLKKVIGTGTCIVAISSGEPCGKGMNTTTMTTVLGGKIYPQAMFEKLIKKIAVIRRNNNLHFKIVLGGSGAWQLAENGHGCESGILGEIDHVITGYCEGNVADLFSLIARNKPLPRIIEGVPAQNFDIPAIAAPSTMGVVEISRGCGMGCMFCTIADTPMLHLPKSLIVSDIQTNIRGGMPNIAILSEDIFRYGSSSGRVDAGAVIDMLETIRNIDGLGIVQIDHANIASVAQLTDAQLSQIYTLITGNTGHKKLWINVGVETPNGDLMHSMGCGAKMGDASPDNWGEHCAQQISRLCRAGFMPMVSLMLALPDETSDHIEKTIAWVQSIAHEEITVFPLIYAPINSDPSQPASKLTKQHWDLIRLCYNLNFLRVPGMYWDNQRAAGVPFSKRLLLQVMGRGQMGLWKAMMAMHCRRAPE